MTRPTATILRLQGSLARIDELKRQHEALPEPLQALQNEHHEVQAQIEQLESDIQEAKLEQRSAEGEVEDQQQKADQYQEQISQVQTQREYGALLTEIDTSKGKAKESEERALAAGERLEAATAQLEELRGKFEELSSEFDEKRADWEKNKPAVLEEIAGAQSDVEALENELSPQVRAIFRRLYERHDGRPIARVISVERLNKRAAAMWRCSECNYSIRPQLVVEAKTSEELALCERCQKILVVEDDDSGADEEE